MTNYISSLALKKTGVIVLNEESVPKILPIHIDEIMIVSKYIGIMMDT